MECPINGPVAGVGPIRVWACRNTAVCRFPGEEQTGLVAGRDPMAGKLVVFQWSQERFGCSGGRLLAIGDLGKAEDLQRETDGTLAELIGVLPAHRSTPWEPARYDPLNSSGLA